MTRALALVALVAVSASGAAQERPTVLPLPAGTRALGVGDAFVAGRTPEVLFYNPAQMVVQPGIATSVQRYGSASTSGSMAAVYPLPGGAIGVGVQLLEFGGEPIGLEPVPLGERGPLSSSSTVASLALNFPAIKSVRSGVAAKFIEERIGATRGSGIAVDVGVARDFFGRTTLAFAAQNLGPALKLDSDESSLPRRYTLGAAAQAPPLLTWFDLAASASISYLPGGTIAPAGGIELTYVPLDGWGFTGRVGGRRVVDRSDASPLTMGAGVSLDRVSLDYAFHPMDGIGSSHRVGLRVR